MTYYIIPPKIVKNLHLISLALVYAVLAFFFLLNGKAIFPGWEDSWTASTMVYMVGVGLFLSIYEKIPDEVKKPVVDSFLGFIIGFPIAAIIFILISDTGWWLQGINPLPVYLIIPTLVFQIVIVASSEEIIFRGAIFGSLFKINWTLAYLGSSLLFGLFHYAAYGGDMGSILVAFAMGIVFCYLTDRWNIGVAIAVHSAYNSYLLGAVNLSLLNSSYTFLVGLLICFIAVLILVTNVMKHDRRISCRA